MVVVVVVAVLVAVVVVIVAVLERSSDSGVIRESLAWSLRCVLL